MKTLKVGDLVTVDDGSYSIRVDSYENTSRLLGTCNDVFKVIGVNVCGGHTYIPGDDMAHDIFIKNTHNNEIYLHSSILVDLCYPEIKEVTMKDLEEKYGCKVKVVK